MRIKNHPVLEDIKDKKIVNIIVNGKKIKAFEGDTIAAAMFDNNLKVNRTTPRYYEPRGVFCNKGRCTDCIMKVDGQPNIRTCVTRVRDGMVVESIYGLGEWEVINE
jgi:predicted molibdopterin-dependent oxidoreductase YjgC